MARIGSIVEGHGEVAAVPILVRRVAEVISPANHPEVLPPIRVPRYKLVREGELERAVELAARQTGDDGRILILLDADTDCPGVLGPTLLARAKLARADRSIHVVIAKVEFESWFLAAASSIAGRRGIDAHVVPPTNPESIRNAKRWLSDRMPRGASYRETLDQPALSAVFDLEAAKSAPSFDKMWRELAQCLMAG